MDLKTYTCPKKNLSSVYQEITRIVIVGKQKTKNTSTRSTMYHEKEIKSSSVSGLHLRVLYP